MNRIVTAWVCIVCIGGCGFNCEEKVLTLERDPVVGEFIYDNRCATCHGPDGEGISGPPLTDIVAQRTSCDIVDTVRNGSGEMPAIGADFDDQELADIVEFVTLEFQ